MKLKFGILSLAVTTVLSGCWLSPETMMQGRVIRDDAAYDQGTFIQRGHQLQEMIAGIWVDGNGCEHWIIDDGIEGYMSTRWGPDGLPYCPPGNVAYSTKGFVRTKYFESSMTANGRRNVPGEYTSIDAQLRYNNPYLSTPTNIGGTIPFQQYVPNADINETWGLFN